MDQDTFWRISNIKHCLIKSNVFGEASSCNFLNKLSKNLSPSVQ
jgi:hypothetical protein